jgi:hypothetical protein
MLFSRTALLSLAMMCGGAGAHEPPPTAAPKGADVASATATPETRAVAPSAIVVDSGRPSDSGVGDSRLQRRGSAARTRSGGCGLTVFQTLSTWLGSLVVALFGADGPVSVRYASLLGAQRPGISSSSAICVRYITPPGRADGAVRMPHAAIPA